ncbi:MAG: GxxExxY protein [Planctomycetes bacterium]|nr:GxxExxY protein [Planctomycetota bacterium]
MTDDAQSDPQTHAIIGAAMEVHRVMGHGFSETVYQEALAKEFKLRGIPFVREARLPINYKGEQLETVFKADFLCFEDIVVELKALDKIGDNEVAQTLNYLRASNKQRGLILNFGAKSLQFKRVVWNWK